MAKHSLLPASVESFRQQLLAEPRPVVIVGAAVVSEAIWHACRDLGIEVACFCDNNRNRTFELKYGLPVRHTPALPRRLRDAVFLIGVADIGDVVAQLQGLGFANLYSAAFLLRSYDVAGHVHSAPYDFVEYAVATCLNCHDNYLTPDAVFLRSVDLIVTEKCSLKCRDCANLMQYYRHPVDCPLEELKLSLDGLFAVADAVNEIRIIGGEPFMHRDVHLLVRRLAGEEKLRRIVIYTNGTIVPREEQAEALCGDKTLVLITDYGALSRQRAELERYLAGHGISYHTIPAGGWSDCSRIRRHQRDDREQAVLFANCCARNTLTLSRGRLYRCPFSANAARLGAIPDFSDDCFVVPAAACAPQEGSGAKLQLREFLIGKRFLASCDYCDGRPFGAAEIEPAVQTAQPLPYEVALGPGKKIPSRN